MLDTVLGLPVHALVVHAVVVLVPLAALGAIAIAAVPRWRSPYGILVAGVATAGLVMVPVAVTSGQRLRERIPASGVVADQIDAHATLGRVVIWPTLVMWVFTVALVLLSRGGRTDRSRSRGLSSRPSWSAHTGQAGRLVTTVALLAALSALVAAGVVARAGHLGSTAVWSCTIGSSACK